ncbi:glycoside hydrolase family 3 C-terminal domain-containing protein [Bacteroides sp.]
MNCRKITLLVGFLILVSFCAQAQKWYTSDVDRKVEELLKKMTVEEKLSYIGGVDWMYTRNIDRLGIQRMKMSDGPQGLGTHGQSTAYPATVLLAAAWNDELAYEYGKSLGRDCNARGIQILLGPAVNIYRAPMCGRNFEYMGEDPYLAARTSTGYIKGVQDQGVMAVVKHFSANNSDYDRHEISNDIDERALHEIYFPAFKSAVQEAGVAAVMSSYNLIHGVYTTESPWLLKGVLRDQWGFNGLVMSDWGSTHHCIPAIKSGLDLEMPGSEVRKPEELAYYLKTGDITIGMIDEMVRHILRAMIAFDFKDGTREDKSIPLNDPKAVETALNVAREGIVLLKNAKNTLPIDSKSVKNIVVVGKNAHGYIHGGGSGSVHPFQYTSMYDGIRKEAERHHINVTYVDELDFLPEIMYTGSSDEKGLHAAYFNNKELKGAPVAERTENKINYSWTNGTGVEGLGKENYSVRWTGVVRPDVTGEYEFTVGGDDGYRLYINNELLADEWGVGSFRNSTVTRTMEAGKEYAIRFEYFQEGGGAAVSFIWERKGDKKDPFVDRLNLADRVIACFGHTSDTEGEGADRTFALPKADAKMIARTLKCKKPVIGIVNAGGNVEMQEWEPGLKALLWGWYAGQEGGTAVADILFGNVNPSGKLPMTFEKRWEDNPAYHSYYDPDGDKHVAYTEGVFIGYRGYDKLQREVQYPFGYGLSYTDFRLSGLSVSEPLVDGSVEVSCTLTNTGKRDGAQVVQLYIGKEKGIVERPEKELKQFKKVYLKAGESATVKMVVSKEAFTYYSIAAGKFVQDGGTYNVMLGFSSRDIRSRGSVRIPAL